MKTDKELLELAAKAAGYNIKAHEDGTLYSDYRCSGYWGVFNPLNDDGDALRLAAKMEISINHFDSFVKAQVSFEGCAGRIVTAMIERGRLDAMRRVIVLAAAAIGESK